MVVVVVVCVCVCVGGRGINRLNDTKEQCCDSEQLASSPSVDRPGVLVSAGLHACTHALDKDRLSCDCSFRCRAPLTEVIDGICRGTKKKQKT